MSDVNLPFHVMCDDCGEILKVGEDDISGKEFLFCPNGHAIENTAELHKKITGEYDQIIEDSAPTQPSKPIHPKPKTLPPSNQDTKPVQPIIDYDPDQTRQLIEYRKITNDV